MLLSTHTFDGHHFAVNEGDAEISVTLLDIYGEATGHTKRALIGSEPVTEIINRLVQRCLDEIRFP